MKQILLTLALSLIMVSAFAQEHLSFKGIPIAGSMTSFCQQLESKGFKKFSAEKELPIPMYIGDFTGRQATVAVGATDDGNNVFSVFVMLDPSKEWKMLLQTYDYYKSLYTRKYGEPSSNTETKQDYVTDDFTMMAYLSRGRVTWESSWNVTAGTITLSIQKADGFGGLVSILYRDDQNAEVKIQNDLEDI